MNVVTPAILLFTPEKVTDADPTVKIPTILVLPLTKRAVDAPPTTTLLANVETPETVKASISAVPFKYRSFHCFEDEPRLKVSSVVGIRSDANSPPTTTLSPSVSPSPIVPPRNVTTPTNSEYPCTFKF